MKNSRVHLLSCFNILQTSYRAIIILCLSLVLHNNTTAGDIAGGSPLPSDIQFQKDRNLTLNVLKALLYEEKQYYYAANRIWKSLPQDLEIVQEHVFQSGLFRYSGVVRKNVPITENSTLLMSRYLSWQKKWADALHLLEKTNGEQTPPVDTNLEMIRLNLSLGDYGKAKQIMDHLVCDNRRDQLQLEILRVWYFILSGDQQQAVSGINTLEEDFLYLPVSKMFPVDFFGDKREQKVKLNRSLVRFPTSDEMVEQLVHLLIVNDDWDGLSVLVRSQQTVNPDAFGWRVLAELYLRTGQDGKLDKLLHSLDGKDLTPDYFDYLARKAIEDKQWEQLNRISRAYQNRYPGLLDGKLYQFLYLHYTGQTEKLKSYTNNAELQPYIGHNLH